MFFGILDNTISGIFSIISFFIISISFGDSIRRILKIKVLLPIFDSICIAILSTITVSIFLQILNIYQSSILILICVLGFIADIILFYLSPGYITLKTGIMKFLSSPDYRNSLYNGIKSHFLNNKSMTYVWIIIILYQILFVILPAVIYPLPLETDMKQHTIFLMLIVKEQTILPSWTPIVPTLQNVFYQLGCDIYAACGYYLLIPFGVPAVTFLNFWFRIHFLVCFYMIVYLSSILFKDTHNSNLYSAITLLLTPVFFWITRWGGFSWIMGFIILIFIISLCLDSFFLKINLSKNSWSYQLLIIWAFILLGFIHINVAFYGFLFLNVFFIHILFLHHESLRFNALMLLFTLVIDLLFSLLLIAPSLILQFFSTYIQNQLYSSYIPVDIGGSFSLIDIFVINYFLGGLVSTVSACLFLLKPSYKNRPSLFILFNWFLLMFSIFFIIKLPLNPVQTIFFYFPGANYIIKTWRILYFIFFMLAIFSPIFWNYISKLPFKNIQVVLPAVFFILVCGFGLVSAYSLELPISRDYTSYTMESYQFIKKNIPPGSLFMNDFYGQWIPMIADMRITFSADPLYTISPAERTINVFFTLFAFMYNHTNYINTTYLFSARYFNSTVDYVFVSTHVFSDIAWKWGQADANGISNRSIYNLGVYSNLRLIYGNPEDAIYKVLW